MKNEIRHWTRWVIKKLLRAFLYLTIAIIVVFCAYQYLTRNDLWIEFTQNNIRVKICVPEDIVKNKDCNKFLEWQDDYLPKEMQKECPWPKNDNG
jgi:hypothetical protein